MVTKGSKITVLPGVGKVRAEHYAKLGIETIGDLIAHYPRAYEDRAEIRTLREARRDGKTALILTVATEPRVVRLRSHKSFLKVRAFDDSGVCEMVYFNQDHLKNVFRIGTVFRFWGKVEPKGKNGFQMSSPVAEPWAPGAKLPPFCAVYRLTEGLTGKQIAKDLENAFRLLEEAREEDPLPVEIRESRHLLPLWQAERLIHEPSTAAELEAARRSLVYREFFDFSLGMAITRKRAKPHSAPICDKGALEDLTKFLPYHLTGAQERVIGEIKRDLAKDIPMSRMVVGDVGCGKTICAAAAIWFAVASGRQAALMAPTEILARQHFADLSELFGKLGVSCALLVGATPAGEKRKIKTALAAGTLQVVIGTHALLSDGVEFALPGLVVTDEQHRFGARQRAILSEKNQNAHLLVMSATPIPRSLALILYGDLDLSRVDEMPAGRQRVDTYVVDESYRTRLNGFIQKQLDAGGCVYVVCPAVEEEENEPGEVTLDELFSDVEREEKPPLRAAVNYAKEMQETFPNARVAFLHGKMKSREKEEVMERFCGGEIDILVSTTVIEVGVNVPRASLMVVENAERFGLSQLHQLRGRVGRGEKKSYCVLVCGAEKISDRTRERLDVMRQTYDGYLIAEKDLEQRGPGDFLGTGDEGAVRQSGVLAFRLGNLAEDSHWMTFASEDAKKLVEADPELRAHPLLSDHIHAMTAGWIS